MAELKTQKNTKSVTAFLNSIEDPQKRKDAKTLCRWMKIASKQKPAMWGDSIIGFGSYHYRYASGREGDWFRIGISPRKQYLSLYIHAGFDAHQGLLQKLGKYKPGSCCLNIKRLADIDETVLQELIARTAKAPICSET
ncbi:DUF1801 domain-containing protein [Pelagicoccus sp. SDUM812002]|uniref:DUF1801 domain-containing protein n=1 Tax=Pelagicoccus sp. SDUM812002 TaxID=3041266 RepID=UPI00280DCA75|nr:DUF1801 domain-containing protein [Pelagicoccus sp. SDUM812002]MDQ8186759.1 DUF1801 domain-containing protein [Pelagicoccus sp. SDUM812002]